MKIDRLFSIVHILLNKEKVTARELAAKFEVSTRTIYRDIETLSISGIPIYTDKGSGGGISLLDDFVLNKSLISEEEKNSIILGLEVLQATEYEEIDNRISKLKTLFEGNDHNYIEVDFSSFSNDKQKHIFENIKMALKNSRTLDIVYSNNLGVKSKRHINPLKLIFKKQRWYLIAFCKEREDYRTFRISRILDSKLTEVKFNRDDYDISNHVLVSNSLENLSSIKLTLDIKALVRVEEEFNLSHITFQDVKTLIVEFDSEIDDWIVNYIITYSDYLINVEPLELKDKLKDKVCKIMSL